MSDKKRPSRAYRSINDRELDEARLEWAREFYKPVPASPEPSTEAAIFFPTVTSQDVVTAPTVTGPDKKRWRDRAWVRVVGGVGFIASAVVAMVLAHGDSPATPHARRPAGFATPYVPSSVDPRPELAIDSSINPSVVHKFERTFIDQSGLPPSPYRYQCLRTRAYDTTQGANLWYNPDDPDFVEVYPRSGGGVLRLRGIADDGAYLEPADQEAANILWAFGCYLYAPAPPHIQPEK